MENKISTKFAALAALGLISAACGGSKAPAVEPGAPAGDMAAEKSGCKGENGCNGEGEAHSCKGEHGCKAETDKAECKGEHGCKGEGDKAECKGESGCKGAPPTEPAPDSRAMKP